MVVAGKDEGEQLRKTMELLGAPTERIWPGVTGMPHVASGIILTYLRVYVSTYIGGPLFIF